MFKKLTKQEYQDLFKKALFSTFFHASEWHEFLEKEFKWLKFEYYSYGEKLLFPVARAGNKLISLPFCEYGGPLPLKENINFSDFQRDILEEFGKNIKIKFHPEIKIGGAESDISTRWIENLKNISEQELLNSFRKTLRHEIRNAQDRNLEIKKCSNEQEFEKFYSLYVANLKRKKTVPYPFPVIKFLYQQPSSEILLALRKNKGSQTPKIIAGSLFLHYNKFVHYFLSASDYKYRDLGANYLILWEKIKILCGKDLIFDLGASPQGSALEIFKRGWGGTEYPIYQIGIKKSPAFAKASAGREESLRYSKIRNIWGLLPVFVIKKISRYFIKYRI